MAILHANRILEAQENLTTEEQPPLWMWQFEDLLAEWFEDIKRQREEKYGSAGNDDVEVPLMKNDYA